MLLAGLGGLMVGLMIVSPFPMASWLKYLIIAAVAGVAAFFGKAYQEPLKVLGTPLLVPPSLCTVSDHILVDSHPSVRPEVDSTKPTGDTLVILLDGLSLLLSELLFNKSTLERPRMTSSAAENKLRS